MVVEMPSFLRRTFLIPSGSFIVFRECAMMMIIKMWYFIDPLWEILFFALQFQREVGMQEQQLVRMEYLLQGHFMGLNVSRHLELKPGSSGWHCDAPKPYI